MTLNITLVASWLMLQSSDFRLTVDYNPVSETAQKLVVLHYKNWSGLLCYTGIAKWGDHDTAGWLSRILTHEISERTPQDVISCIVEQGNKWLIKIPVKYRFHTFTLIAYIRRIPYIYLISNFEWIGGRKFHQPLDEFRVDYVRPRRPRCLPTGWTDAVTPEQQKQLEAHLATTTILSRENLEKLRYILASASREASYRSKHTVGENCIVAHLLPDGSGEAQVFGNLKSAFVPTLISHGANVANFVPEILRTADEKGPHRLVGVTWTANGSETLMGCAYRDISSQSGTGWPSPPEI